MTEQKLDKIRNYIITNVMRNPDIMYNQIRDREDDPVDIIASLYEELHKEVTGKPYEYMFHWANKIGSDCSDDLFKNMKDGVYMEELTNMSSIEDFQKLEPFKPTSKFNGFVVIPTDEMHDSGYQMMKVVLLDHWKVVGCIDCGCDVIHLNGIGGYGKYGEKYNERVQTKTAPATDWCIDMTPKGVVRVFCSRELEIDDLPLSSLQLWIKE